MWSKDEGICKLTPFRYKIPPAVSPPKSVTITSRLYCTALRLCNYHNDDLAEYSDRCDLLEVQRRYLILDVGKSTVDMTALVYSPTDSCYEFVIRMLTCTVGGMQVNSKFWEFLQELVDDYGFSKFLTRTAFFFFTVPRDNYHHAVIKGVVDCDFEKLKNQFGEKGLEQSHSQMFRVTLDKEFFECYKDQIQKHDDSKIRFYSQTQVLEIEYSKMAEFYQPVLQDIQRYVMCALDKFPLDSIDAVWFAGEFGGCRYVYEHMKTALSRHRKLRQAAFLVPRSYDVVTSHGAAYYCQPTNIITLVTNASYGINASVLFQEDDLAEKNMVFYSTGRVWHQNVFLPFVYQGERVKMTDVFTIGDLLPPQQSQTEITFHVYHSTNPKVRYTTDKGTWKIGELTLDLPNPNNLPNSERKLKISMTTTSVEIIIRAQALYLPDQPTVTIVLR